VDIAGIAPTIEEVPARTILYVRAGSGVDAESTHAALNAAYAEVLTTMAANGLRATGQPLTLTSAYDGVTWTFDAGIPVDGTAVPEDTSALVGSTPDGKVARLVHVGGFATMPGTIDKLYAWIVVHGYAPRDRMIQDYVSDPSTTPAGRMETRISVPIR
jgi:effector-binding domain-containing protein